MISSHFSIKILLVFALLSSSEFSKEVILVSGDVGTAISYGPPYTPTKCNGDSHDQFPSNNMFAAVGPGLWNNGAACGRRYKMRCLSGVNRPCTENIIHVVVVDKCDDDPCPSNILLSRDAFAALSRHSDGKINVEYAQI